MWRIDKRKIASLPIAGLLACLALSAEAAPAQSTEIGDGAVKPLRIDATSATPVTCTAGTWAIGNDANQTAPVQYQTTHFAFRWNGTDATTAQATTAGTQLENLWTLYINDIGFKPPNCNSATKYKVNITLNPAWGLSGGLDGQGYPGMWMAPAGLADHWGLGHEFTHALQGGTGGLRDSPYSGWLWEDHANFMAHQQDEYKDNYHCTELRVNAPHIYFGSTRDRYCSWQFFEYLKNAYGWATINDIWANAPQPGTSTQATADPFEVLMSNKGWTISRLNDEFLGWAAHNVTWDYTTLTGYSERAGMFATYGQYTATETYRANRTVKLDPMDLTNRRFSSPVLLAPERWGYNVIRLIPDTGATSIKVTFRGVIQSAPNTTTLPGLNNEPSTVPQPNSDWRWTVVVVSSTGLPRYNPTMRGSDADQTVTLQTGDQAVYLVVMGTPSAMHKIRWDQPYYSIYRYPYMVQFTNAWPDGYQASAPAPFANSHQHTNGNGWVSNSATVDATAYVGPYAQVRAGSVTGNARIQEHAIVDGGTVTGNAVVGGAAIINNGVTVKDNAVVQTTFMGLGFFEPNAVIGGTAKLKGDVELRGGPTINAGTYSGFVDQTSASDPAQGSTQTQMINEVTATPTFTWR